MEGAQRTTSILIGKQVLLSLTLRHLYLSSRWRAREKHLRNPVVRTQ